MGCSQPGEMKRLVEIAPPDIAALTQISLQHTAHFQGGTQEIAFEKGAIFSQEKTEMGFINHENPHLDALLHRGVCPKTTFSIFDSQATYYLDIGEEASTIYFKGQALAKIKVKFLLKPFYHNFLCAFAIAHYLSVDVLSMVEAANTLTPPPMRYEIIEKEGMTFINDAYNANPDSMKASLESLKNYRVKGKKIAVLSEMDDLGNFSEEAHSEIGKVALNHVDCLLLIGNRIEFVKEMWKKAGKMCYYFSEKKMLLEHLKKISEKGDVILLKGARVYALEELLDHFKS